MTKVLYVEHNDDNDNLYMLKLGLSCLAISRSPRPSLSGTECR